MGEYVEMDRPRRLVFTLFDEKYSLEFERVIIEFTPHRTGCELSLTHETKPELAQQVSRDWIRILDALAAALGEVGRESLAPGLGFDRSE
jgi:hypothetical protein